MESTETLLLQRRDIDQLLGMDECMDAVENAFRQYAEGKALPPKVLGLPSSNGVFHIKAGILGLERTYFVAKVNANFPGYTCTIPICPLKGALMRVLLMVTCSSAICACNTFRLVKAWS